MSCRMDCSLCPAAARCGRQPNFCLRPEGGCEDCQGSMSRGFALRREVIQQLGGLELVWPQQVTHHRPAELPLHLPILVQAYPEPVHVPWVALHGGRIFGVTGRSITPKHRRPLREVYRLAPSTKLALELYVEDRVLEGIWAERRRLIPQLSQLGFDLILSPNFSVWRDASRFEQLVQQRRAFAFYHELREAGLPALPDVGWSRFEPDGRLWAEWINSQPGLTAVSIFCGGRKIHAEKRAHREGVEDIGLFHRAVRPEVAFVLGGVHSPSRLRDYRLAAPGRQLVICNGMAYACAQRRRLLDQRSTTALISARNCFFAQLPLQRQRLRPRSVGGGLTMPSKGGRRSAGDPAVTGAAPLAAQLVQPVTIAYADILARLEEPLRRGTEVNRFNELARREDELGPEELEELYGCRLRRLAARLRRLDRLAASADEEQLRQGLEEYWARLRDVRRLEDRMGLEGPPSQIDLGAEQRAIDRLIALSGQRPHGLIAGSDGPPVQPAGRVRLSEIPFAPTDADREIYVLAPESLPAEALARNVEAVAADGARLHLVRNASDIPGGAEPPLVLNWGGSEELPAGLVALNRPEAVRISSDQSESLRRLGELAPRTVLNPEDVALLRSERVVAKRRQGARGSGKAVLGADSPPGQLAGYDLYQQFIPDRREYRVSLLSGRVVSAYERRAPEGSSTDDLRPDWIHERLDTVPPAAVQVAREAARRIGLDYAGVDIVEDLSSGRFYCLEANAAPGMSPETLRGLYAQVQQAVRGRLGRAS